MTMMWSNDGEIISVVQIDHVIQIILKLQVMIMIMMMLIGRGRQSPRLIMMLRIYIE